MIHSHALIKVACKIFGLFFLIQVVTILGFIPQGIIMVQQEDTWVREIYGYFALPFLYFIFAYVFIKYADTIAQKLDPVEREIEISPDNNWSQVLYNVGMRLIGVYMVFTGVPKVINEGINIVARFHQINIPLPPHRLGALLDIWSEGIAAVIYLGLGIYLLAGGSIPSKLQNVMNRDNG
ncbi:MAG: hypothetical protein F4Y39_21900 [Gemmatimonadetes bacterium]|nr:hypothetical protein [Gemmatimonadota bacterium]MYF72772.1 hypothetical protein [Gemmatimonadota bacterium]MYK54760.1 hypothetical protein [Gemmatimonadota bacterium]